MKFLVSVTLIAATATLALAQYSDSPAPPRINIPGAIPLPVLRAQNGGQAAPHQGFRSGPVLVRTRRPLKGGRLQSPSAPLASSAPAPLSPRAEFEAKPVTEEIEEPIEDQGPFVPSPAFIGSSKAAPHQQFPLSQQAPSRVPQPKLLPQSQFFEPNHSLGDDDGPNVPRFQPQERPTAVPVQVARYNNSPAPAPQKIHRPTPQAYRSQDQDEHRPVVRPTPRYTGSHDQREKKPVAQILRKYREEHEDGTITWGFENDDGSFKEETIGIDCVTRGRYGYVDPDGEKREYSYETGILCDPNKRDEEEQEEEVAEQPEYVPHVKHFKRPQFKNQ